jgi:anti-anti-sigma factor
MAANVITREAERAIVRPDGDVVAGTVAELRTMMRGMLADGIRELVIDFSAVEMVDSSGIGLLIAAHNSLAKVGGNVSVIHASQDLLELFRTMRIEQHFKVSGKQAEQ